MHIIVRQDIAQERYNVCKTCTNFSNLRLCKLCNCFMPVKVKFALAACPVGKWNMERDSERQQPTAYSDLE